MPNITRGDRPGGLMAYLAGPGRHNEHVEPHLVAGSGHIMAWHGEGRLDRSAALAIAAELDLPRKVHDTEIRRGHVWHCSLSLSAREGIISEHTWTAIAHEVVDELGFTDAGGASPCPWVAVHHGQSTDGNDHIHLAVGLIREDGTSAQVWGDYPKTQELCTTLERRYGLEVLESREAGYSLRGEKPAEQRTYAACTTGPDADMTSSVPGADPAGGGAPGKTRRAAPETLRATVERRVRGHAAASLDEAEFVRRCRRGGLLVRPRFAAGRDDVVLGYSAATRPSQEDRAAGVTPRYFGGGHLARDLTLPRLRDRWHQPSPGTGPCEATNSTGSKRPNLPGDGPDDNIQAREHSVGEPTLSLPLASGPPAAATAEAAREAVAEWRAAHRGLQIAHPDGRETAPIGPEMWEQCHRDLAKNFVRDLALTDTAGFADVAHDAAGVLAAWSLKVEGRPGPLARASRDLSRYAQLRAHRVPTHRAPHPGVREAAMLVFHATASDRGSQAYAILLHQLMQNLVALRDHHRAATRLQAAHAIEMSLSRDLGAIDLRLSAPPLDLEARSPYNLLTAEPEGASAAPVATRPCTPVWSDQPASTGPSKVAGEYPAPAGRGPVGPRGATVSPRDAPRYRG